MTILDIRQLYKRYPIYRGVMRRVIGYHDIIKNLSFTVQQGEILAIVGESGCGKSTLARLMMGLEPPSQGEIYFHQQRIDCLSHRAQMPIRQAIQMVFQDPASTLNERFSIAKILQEPLDIHAIGNRIQRRQAVKDILEEVELPGDFIHRYPHELSGGQRQRIAIARSMILQPQLLLLDEPLSALDVSLQAQMLTLFRRLQSKHQLTIVIISHDLGLVEDFSDRTLVLHYGKIAELRETAALFAAPQHDYSKQLLASMPHKLGKTRF